MSHPCLSCGACCVSYRVAFHWLETNGPDAVPAELVGTVNPREVAMRGTDQPQPRCVALAGTPGAAVSCTIYARRPSPCRELAASFENGTPSDQCERARVRHGMAPLTPEDWAHVEGAALKLDLDPDFGPGVGHVAPA